MRQAKARATRPSLIGKIVLSAVMAATLIVGQTGTAAAARTDSRYAAIVIDANTGKTLFEAASSGRRFPASLTKMMTLYLTFEAMSQGRINRDTRIPISAKAAAEPPTKIGLKPGQSLRVEEAIFALITKSANDISTATGEFLGGSEQRFAQMMTAKARQLGMSGTVFRNAHGLPNDGQFTTARDMATLGLALREHFPQYYAYFSTRSATVAGRPVRTHNNLLGRVQGVDGIKTGYIRASGFNLVTSVKLGDRSVVAVVMGGASARSRDAHMRDLLEKYLPRASTRDGAPLVASRRALPAEVVTARAAAQPVLPRAEAPTPDNRPTDSIAAYAPAPRENPATVAAVQEMPRPTVSPLRPSAPVPQASIPAGQPEIAETGEGDVDVVETGSTGNGWAIQVASAGSEADARAILARTKTAGGRALASAQPFTETFAKGGNKFWRARFGGFGSKAAAWDACGALKRQSIACYAVER